MNSLLRAYRKGGNDASAGASATQATVTVPLPVSVDAVAEPSVLPPSRFSRKAPEAKGSFFASLPAPKDPSGKRPRTEDNAEVEAAAKRTVAEAENVDVDVGDYDVGESDDGDVVSALPALQPRAAPVAAGAARETDTSASYGPARPTTYTGWYPEVDEPAPYPHAGDDGAMAAPAIRFGGAPPPPGPVVVDVSQAALLADQQQIQSTLAHELKGGSATVMTAGGKRRHQLGKMATEAVQNMERLQQEKLQNTRTIGQVRMKVRRVAQRCTIRD